VSIWVDTSVLNVDSLVDNGGTLVIWETDGARMVSRHCAGFHGPIASICWLSSDTLAFGCADGTIHIHKQDIQRSEVIT